ncbi:unnamed protein product [Blepharisma stoltei]|uniref:VPS9 domain-containing protein n=1 Tax=Blepharisma stoltei TaxID=1481888 RepID=A0AAU9J584_9CILI|nr:unnamed protein product [Blepharisma stoltei]
MKFNQLNNEAESDPNAQPNLQSEETKVIKSVDLSLELTNRNSFILGTEYGLDSADPYMPSYKIDIPFSVSCSTVLDIFTKVVTRKRFQVIEKTTNIATAVHKEGYGFKDIILCCLPAEERQKGIMSAVRLSISINERKCTRTVMLKGIYGFPQTICPVVEDFKVKIEAALEQPPEEREIYMNISKEAEEESIMTCKHESSSYYQFHKILSSESYTLGKSISDFISSFTSQYRNPQESVGLLPQPIESIKLMVEDSVEALFSHYNFGRTNAESMMHFCRPAVEKYMYGKLFPHLFDIYKAKTSLIEQKFIEKRTQILEFNDEEILEKLQINEKYRLTGVTQPYAEAIEALRKLEQTCIPVEKLNCLLSMVAAMKTCVLDYSKGKDELNSMDDELPVLMYIAIKSQTQFISAELALISDYVGTKFENEKRIIVNLEVAIRYIANEFE